MKKRISLITAIVLFAIITQAQRNVSFGLRGGINFQNINGKDEEGNKLDNEMVTGFHLGIISEIAVAPQFYFQPGLLYTVKGAKNKEEEFGETIKTKVKISYLELPLNLVYKPNLGNGRLLLGFGPYVGFGIGGKVTYKEGGSSLKQEIKFKNKVSANDPEDVAYFKPLDAGVNMLAGYEFSNKVSFQLNTQLGLTKINPKYEGSVNDKTAAKNTGFGFSLGYRL